MSTADRTLRAFAAWDPDRDLMPVLFEMRVHAEAHAADIEGERVYRVSVVIGEELTNDQRAGRARTAARCAWPSEDHAQHSSVKKRRLKRS